MTIQTLASIGVYWPPLPPLMISTNNTAGPPHTSYTMDAAAEKCGFVGKCYLEGRTGSKTISSAGGKIHFFTGSSTFANASTTIRVGIQDVDGTTGNSGAGGMATPDGTFDVYDDLVGGTDTIGATSTITVTMSSGTKTINHGDLIAIVFDMTSRGGADSVNVMGISATSFTAGLPHTGQNLAGSWVRQASLPNAIIEFDDGTYGVIDGTIISQGGNTTAIGSVGDYNSGSSPNEYGLLFQLPFPCKVDGAWISGRPNTNSADFNVILYSDPLGTPSAQATVSVDAHTMASQDGLRPFVVTFGSEVSLTANTDYAIAFKPTTANSCNMNVLTYANAAFRKFYCGTNASRASRASGAFASNTTNIPLIGVRISGFDDGAGGGGGGPLIGGRILK